MIRSGKRKALNPFSSQTSVCPWNPKPHIGWGNCKCGSPSKARSILKTLMNNETQQRNKINLVIVLYKIVLHWRGRRNHQLLLRFVLRLCVYLLSSFLWCFLEMYATLWTWCECNWPWKMPRTWHHHRLHVLEHFWLSGWWSLQGRVCSNKHALEMGGDLVLWGCLC